MIDVVERESVNLQGIFHKEYKAKEEPEFSVMSPIKFLAVKGTNYSADPNEYTNKIKKLQFVYDELRRICAKVIDITFEDMPLETLYHGTPERPFSLDDKKNWHWFVMFAIPEFVTDDLVTSAINSCIISGKLSKFDSQLFVIYEERSKKYCQKMFQGWWEKTIDSAKGLFESVRSHGDVTDNVLHEIYLTNKYDYEQQTKIIQRVFIKDAGQNTLEFSAALKNPEPTIKPVSKIVTTKVVDTKVKKLGSK